MQYFSVSNKVVPEQFLWVISSTWWCSPDWNRADALNEDLYEALDLCLSEGLSQRKELGQTADLCFGRGSLQIWSRRERAQQPFQALGKRTARRKHLHFIWTSAAWRRLYDGMSRRRMSSFPLKGQKSNSSYRERRSFYFNLLRVAKESSNYSGQVYAKRTLSSTL